MARHRAADGGRGRQIVRLALSLDALWSDDVVAPNRRLFWRLVGRTDLQPLRELPMDVVRRRFVRGYCGATEFTDTGGSSRTSRRDRIAANPCLDFGPSENRFPEILPASSQRKILCRVRHILWIDCSCAM